jgi:succinate-semialdehyde dehydrogenase/glutarate-semialdehyde dehydrogenase
MPYQLYINGEWRDAKAGGKHPVMNPATGEKVAEFTFGDEQEAIAAIDAAERAFVTWRKTTVYERAGYLVRAAQLIRERAEEIARVVTLENGKPLAESRAEVVGCAGWFEWFAEEAKHAYGRIVPTHAAGKRISVIHQPVGVAVCVTPWNFPVNLMARKIGAGLAAGCTLVCRPASETPLSAMLMFECLHDAKLPPGVCNLVTGPAATTVAAMMQHRACRKIAFTGSTPVGKQLMRQAADRMIRVSLELGGHAPLIVFPDVNIETAAEQAVGGKFRNAGQSCIAPTRFYVHKSIYSEFREAVVKHTGALKVGNGLDAGVEVGPLLNQKQFDRTAAFVDDAVSKGAKVLTGGKRLEGSAYDNGFFYAPTVLDNIKPEMRLTCEEVFGPVLPLIPFETEEEVITAANKTEYGLAAYVLTHDLGTATRVSDALDYGIVGVNDTVPTVPHAPFGGTKESGMNREGGTEGLQAYLEPKFISTVL